jgi:pseudouridine-5'-phosphate glycosidase/pseudouridine kinase
VSYPAALPPSNTEQGRLPPVSERPLRLADTKHPSAKLLIVGSAAIDITARAQVGVDDALIMHSTAPGNVSLSLGGVARNIAEAAHRVIASDSPQHSPLLVSAIGHDHFGRFLISETAEIGMRVDGLVKSDKRTPICNMILDSSGGLIGGVADMDGPTTATLDGEMVRFRILSTVYLVDTFVK